MSEPQNLALDFEPGSASARIFVETASSYLSDNGAVVITGDCTSEEAIRAEIERLTRELSQLGEEAKRRFAGSSAGAGSDAPATAKEAEGAATAQPKTRLRIDRDLRVGDCMTRPVATVRRNQMLNEADAILRAGEFRHLVVIDDDTDVIVGVVSKRQIALSALDWVMGHGVAAYEKMLAATSVKDVMETQVIAVAKEAPLAEAAQLLSQNKIGCLPVVDDEQLVGILTEGDFVALLREATVWTTEAGERDPVAGQAPGGEDG